MSLYRMQDMAKSMWAEFPQHLAGLDKHHRTVSCDNCIGVVPCYFVTEGSDEHLVTGYMLKHDNMLKYMRANNCDTPERGSSGCRRG